MKVTMKVKDFIKINHDIDVYDDVCKDIQIAFCGPMSLTEAGEQFFSEVLDYDIEIDLSGRYTIAIVHVDDADEKTMKRKLNKAYGFFYALAGYCDADDYDKWFISPDWGQYAIDPDANVFMCVYKDTTPWYTEDEMNRDNLCDLWFPRKLVQDYYISTGESIMTFVQWLTEECTADDTDGLFQFCKDHGFIAWREEN